MSFVIILPAILSKTAISYDSLMNVIQELKERLSEFQGFKVEETNNRIEVIPTAEDGFNVSLEIKDNNYMVSYDAWHEHFQDADEALKTFMFGLSGGCRLKISYAGKQPVRWLLETKDRSQWVTHGIAAQGPIFYPFWKRKSVRYLSNTIV